jgi:hypothetical protein
MMIAPVSYLHIISQRCDDYRKQIPTAHLRICDDPVYFFPTLAAVKVRY